MSPFYIHMNGLVQECSNTIVNALELLQSCTKPSISSPWYWVLCIRPRFGVKRLHVLPGSLWIIAMSRWYRWSDRFNFMLQYIPRNMHTVFALLCFVVVIHWLIFPYPSGLLHWHCVNLTIAPVPAKQPWWIWIHTSCEFIMNDCITTTKQNTTKPCAYFLGYTVYMTNGS